MDEPHGVIRPAVCAAAQAIDRNDPWVLQAAGDLRLEEKTCPLIIPLGVLGLNLLEGNHALEFPVAGHPDLANTPLGMRTDALEPIFRAKTRGITPFPRLGINAMRVPNRRCR